MADQLIGKVDHYYAKIGVATLVLQRDLKVGETIKIGEKNKVFTQTVTSIQVEHQPVDKAKKGEPIGIKVDQKVKPGSSVFLV